MFACVYSDVEQKDRKRFPKQRRDLKKRCNEYVALDIPIPSLEGVFGPDTFSGGVWMSGVG